MSRNLRFDFVTIFPNIFNSYFSESLFQRALKRGIIKIKIHNLRDYAVGKYKQVDDRPFGGGPGMVLEIKPIYKAIRTIKSQAKSAKRKRVIVFSTRGKLFNSKIAKRLAQYDQLIMICGRYEGVDERVAKYLADEEISVGDYVLSGGELPAIIVAEVVSRYVKGFLGKYESLEDVKGSYPVFTRPAEFVIKKGRKGIKATVPKVLLSGDHKEIMAWRRQYSVKS